MPSETWELIHAERRQLVEDLDLLSAEQWSTPSLCPGWSVHQMLGHVLALTKQTLPKFLVKIIKSGFSFDAMVAKDSANESAGSPQHTLAELNRHLDDTTSPPGPVKSWLGEIVVHGAISAGPSGCPTPPQPP